MLLKLDDKSWKIIPRVIRCLVILALCRSVGRWCRRDRILLLPPARTQQTGGKGGRETGREPFNWIQSEFPRSPRQ